MIFTCTCWNEWMNDLMDSILRHHLSPLHMITYMRRLLRLISYLWWLYSVPRHFDQSISRSVIYCGVSHKVQAHCTWSSICRTHQKGLPKIGQFSTPRQWSYGEDCFFDFFVAHCHLGFFVAFGHSDFVSPPGSGLIILQSTETHHFFFFFALFNHFWRHSVG